MDEKLQTILANIQSLVDQANQLGAGEGEDEKSPEDKNEEGSEDEIEKIMKILKNMGGEPIKKGEDEKSPEDKKEDKEEVKKSDEGTHANDKAEEIINDQGEVNEKNIQEVAKAIINMAKKSSVKKSSTDPEITKAIQLMAEENRELKKSLELLLDGFGLAKTVKEANEVKKSQTVAKETPDLESIKKSIVDEIRGINKASEPENTGWGMDTMQNGRTSVRKSLSDGITNLIGTK